MIDNRVEEIRKHVESIMQLLDLEVTQSNEQTPLRVAKMYCNEVFKNRNNNNREELDSQMKLFSLDSEYSNPVIVRDIPVNSFCEHHFLPFMGTCSVTYIPDDKVIGLSKIPRVVKFFSKKPQLQERLTNEIGDYLFSIIKPKMLKVTMECTHTCVLCRGIESSSSTITSYSRGDI
jgi:GTP cyclohydrolase I